MGLQLWNLFLGKKICSVFSWAGRVPIEKTASVRSKPKLCTFIWANKIFGVKTLMGLDRLKVHFLTLFPINRKVLPYWPKNRECFTWRLLSEFFFFRFSRKDVGRIFRFIITFLQFDQKIVNAPNDNIYLRICVNIFSEGRRQEKYALLSKMI